MDLGLAIVGVLVDLVTDGVLGSTQTVNVYVSPEFISRVGHTSNVPSANVGVAVLGNLLVRLMAGTRHGTLNSLRDVVGGLLNRLHCEFKGGVLKKRVVLKVF